MKDRDLHDIGYRLIGSHLREERQSIQVSIDSDGIYSQEARKRTNGHWQFAICDDKVVGFWEIWYMWQPCF